MRVRLGLTSERCCCRPLMVIINDGGGLEGADQALDGQHHSQGQRRAALRLPPLHACHRAQTLQTQGGAGGAQCRPRPLQGTPRQTQRRYHLRHAGYSKVTAQNAKPSRTARNKNRQKTRREAPPREPKDRPRKDSSEEIRAFSERKEEIWENYAQLMNYQILAEEVQAIQIQAVQLPQAVQAVQLPQQGMEAEQ